MHFSGIVQNKNSEHPREAHPRGKIPRIKSTVVRRFIVSITEARLTYRQAARSAFYCGINLIFAIARMVVPSVSFFIAGR